MTCFRHVNNIVSESATEFKSLKIIPVNDFSKCYFTWLPNFSNGTNPFVFYWSFQWKLSASEMVWQPLLATPMLHNDQQYLYVMYITDTIQVIMITTVQKFYHSIRLLNKTMLMLWSSSMHWLDTALYRASYKNVLWVWVLQLIVWSQVCNIYMQNGHKTWKCNSIMHTKGAMQLEKLIIYWISYVYANNDACTNIGACGGLRYSTTHTQHHIPSLELTCIRIHTYHPIKRYGICFAHEYSSYNKPHGYLWANRCYTTLYVEIFTN